MMLQTTSVSSLIIPSGFLFTDITTTVDQYSRWIDSLVIDELLIIISIDQ